MARGPDKQFDLTEALGRAMKLFWAKGYAAAGLSELLEAMGIGRKSMYDTFGTKRELFLKVLQHYADGVVRRITDLLDADAPPLDNVRRALEHIHTQNGRRVSNGCLLGVGMAQVRSDDAEIAAVLRGHLERLEDAYYRAFRRARTRGDLAPSTRPRDLARAFTATTQGLTLIRRVDDAPATSRGIIRGVLAMLDGVKARRVS
jgi:TetR/AcrR family transcriptional repressor of nem operon